MNRGSISKDVFSTDPSAGERNVLLCRRYLSIITEEALLRRFTEEWAVGHEQHVSKPPMVQGSRVLVGILLILAFLSGAGVVVADGENNSGQNCPGDNPTNAYNSTSETAFEKSAAGRQEALEGGECITKK